MSWKYGEKTSITSISQDNSDKIGCFLFDWPNDSATTDDKDNDIEKHYFSERKSI